TAAPQTRVETFLSIEELLKQAAGLAVSDAGAAPEAGLAVSGAGEAPEESAAESAIQEAEAKGAPVVTEAELSINKTLDSIEKEIEEWENRDRLSTASKVAMVISVIFLLFTGGSALVKHFAPHSPLDLWFDSVQLQAAGTIKHGVDTIKDLFNDADVSETGGEAGAAERGEREIESELLGASAGREAAADAAREGLS
ncbi:MAG: hypothetical protein LBE16_04560, partial [Clostridiales Family XIII bacterium]|nr:hypothetical protein [Clostridiales Family XIII bacterium]